MMVKTITMKKMMRMQQIMKMKVDIRTRKKKAKYLVVKNLMLMVKKQMKYQHLQYQNQFQKI